MAGDTVQQVKERLSIADVVAPYVKLQRAGRSMVGLCPFHKEKTPSFHVSPERGTFHCFGCGEGGDMFAFVQKVEGVDFKEALQLLADKAGVKVEYARGAQQRDGRDERLRSVLARAAQWYAQQLTPQSAAFTYARSRGLSEETISAWQLGAAPDAWRSLLEALTQEGISTEELLAAGLIKEAEGKSGTYYDRFRNRLLFPIRDAAGRVVAFTGRALANDEPAKYLNSPETSVFHKSDVVFGLDRAKDAIRTRRFALLVEGQMDTVLAHQAGFTNAVGLSGTALTDRHLRLLHRYSENLMLALDADTAGLSATARSAMLALKEGMQVKVLTLPEGKDPADLIVADAKDFTVRVQGAQVAVDFFLGVLGAHERDPHRLIALTERIVLPLIAVTKSPLERAHLIERTARTLGLSSEAVREGLSRVPTEPVETYGEPVRAAQPQASAFARVSPRAARETFLRGIRAVYAGTPLAQRVEMEYGRISGASQMPEDAPDEPTLFEVERMFGEAPAEQAADDLLHAYEEAVIREAYQEAVADLRRAESAQDSEAVRKAEQRCAELARRRAAL